jgi:hypothetical protein
MPAVPGGRLGPYEILAPLSAGGMGEVYRARDTRLGRLVAVKALPAGLAADPDRRRRFEQEARAVAALSHPHICVLHDIGSQDGVDFLVMEYLEGETLAARLRSAEGARSFGAAPPIRLTEALNIGAQVADAMANKPFYALSLTEVPRERAMAAATLVQQQVVDIVAARYFNPWTNLLIEETRRPRRMEKPWLDGKRTFRAARIVALLGDKDGAVALLREAIAQGAGISEVPDAYGYAFIYSHCMDLESLRGYPPFEALIKPKG